MGFTSQKSGEIVFDTLQVDDPLKSLQNMSQLLFLAIGSMSYEGKNLYFQDGGIQQLKELRLKYLYNLDSIMIDLFAISSQRSNYIK